MDRGFVGVKFNRDLDVVQIAKAFKQDVKTVQTSCVIDRAVKLSIKTERTGGQSISVRITALPEGMCCPYSLEYLEFVKNGGHIRGDNFCGDRFVSQVSELLVTLEKMLQAYNYDKSDYQTDYFNVRFYGRVSLDETLGKINQYLWMV